MYNPRDFIPAKYKKNTDQIGNPSGHVQPNLTPTDTKTDSPWSDLAKEPEVPEYRSSLSLDDHGIKNELNASDKLEELEALAQKEQFANNLNAKAKNKKPGRKQLTGLLIVFFLAIGVLSSYFLTKQNQDTRQQASIDLSNPYPDENSSKNVGCGSGWYACNVGCCGLGGSVNEGKRYTPILGTSVVWDSNQDISTLPNYNDIKDAVIIELKARGLANDNGTIRLTENYDLDRFFAMNENGKKVYDYCYGSDGSLNTDKCHLVTGGYLYIGGLRLGDPCAPVLEGGGDWCQVIGGESALCSDLGLIRCACGNGIGVIGTEGQSCDNLCGGTNNICESCDSEDSDEPDITPTNTPTATPTPEPLVCASIEMLDSNNNLMEANDDDELKIGDSVRFRCSASGSQENVDFTYQFRIWNKSTSSWVNITDTSGSVAKNISAAYVISSYGNYVVQGRICVEDECQAWETVAGAPATVSTDTSSTTNTSTSSSTTTLAALGEVCLGGKECAEGLVCSSTPAGGCPSGTSCASVPYCHQADGISCTSDSKCFDGYKCISQQVCSGTNCTTQKVCKAI